MQQGCPRMRAALLHFMPVSTRIATLISFLGEHFLHYSLTVHI
jgi:hypothetical protein